jgi:dimethylaniline monooxygenase (N-oxide forming)
MPMERPPEEDCMNDLFRAKYTTKYLDEYVDAKRHSGLSLRERIKFNMDVLSISKVNAKWKIHCADTLNQSTETLLASKIMIANGQSSTPNMPNFQGREGFRDSVIHSIDFGTSTVIKDAAVQHVAVLGAGKSAVDMVYESVKAGKTVHWVIRESGSGGLGPAAFCTHRSADPVQERRGSISGANNGITATVLLDTRSFLVDALLAQH